MAHDAAGEGIDRSPQEIAVLVFDVGQPIKFCALRKTNDPEANDAGSPSRAPRLTLRGRC